MTRDFVTIYWHALEALRDGELEITDGNGNWVPCMDATFALNVCAYRRKPKKVLRPWTPEEAIGKVITCGQTHHVVTRANVAYAYLSDGTQTTYERLLLDGTQPNGEPCGMEVTP